MAFFAHAYNVPEDQRAAVVATDKAGNTREVRLSYELKNVRYKKSTLSISDEFIANKVAPLLNDVGARQGTPKDIFIKVNRSLRKENDEQIRSITMKSTPGKSGDPAPSPEDIDITRRLKEVGEVMGVRVLDHVVIGHDRFFSFNDKGML